MTQFTDLNISKPLVARLSELGFKTPTPIQEQAIPDGLAGRDLLGKAETGTGKTLAFAIPLVERVDRERISPQALVLTPTRELARQVAEACEEIATVRGLSVVAVVGGEPISDQVLALRDGCQIVVGTPGRVLDLNRQRILTLGWVEIAVLDEADRMLDMGFSEDVGKILESTLPERQTLLFSATFPPALKKIADRYMRDPIKIETARGLATVSEITQTYVRVHSRDKSRLLRHILSVSGDSSALVFTNTKRDADRIGRDLWNRGFPATTLHGDYDQEVRNRVLGKFKRGEIDTLVATDVAQRGLDIDVLSAVINYSVPRDPEDYVHRIGRTGRAGRRGVVMSLVDETEWGDFKRILQRTGWDMKEMALPRGLRSFDTSTARRAAPCRPERRRPVRGRRKR